MEKYLNKETLKSSYEQRGTHNSINPTSNSTH